MVDLNKLQKDIYQNKVNKGFNITDINKEFCLTYGEVAEAYEAWRKKKDDLGEELADVAIYLLGLSETNSYEKDELVQEDNDFYTGNLKISNKDFEDFKDIENDIKSNNVLVKVLIFVFIIIVLGIGVVVANNFFNLGLF